MAQILTAFSPVNEAHAAMQLIELIYSDPMALSLGTFAATPAALVIDAWTKWTPDAPPFVKRLWSNGRVLLAVSALLNACIISVPLWLGTVQTIDMYGWAQFAASLVVVLALYLSPYIRDCFADFPEEKD